MGFRSNSRKRTNSRYAVRLRRWNLLAVFAVVSVAISVLNNQCWRQAQEGRHICGSSRSLPLFAEAVSVAVVGVSLNGDEDDNDNEHQTSEGSKADRSLSSSKSSPKTHSNRAPTTSTPSVGDIFRKAWRRALGGGLPGAAAGVVQVFALMWLRTTINYQCRYGGSFFRTLSLLYGDGGIRRFYRGIGFALFQAPFSRFVATASNEGVLALLASLPRTKHWTPAVTTLFASITVGAFRILLMPIDTCKTVLQVDSREGFRALVRRVRAGKVGALYQGAVATAVSSTIGHYPWFVIYNALSAADWLRRWISSKLLRNACIGMVASVVSDTVVNVFRVIKTTKQSIGSKHDFSYSDTIRVIVAADGWKGLFGRGLRTRVFANSVQSILFTVIWRGLAERWGNAETGDEESSGGSSAATKQGVRRRTTEPPRTIAEESEEREEVKL
mmetsp:Transcript_9360/g.27952  ORF Transcript_9360/g.27952 Transcript_9360/m.27952 type:complete len:443 (+) Transcript_9360:344-1672(+)